MTELYGELENLSFREVRQLDVRSLNSGDQILISGGLLGEEFWIDVTHPSSVSGEEVALAHVHRKSELIRDLDTLEPKDWELLHYFVELKGSCRELTATKITEPTEGILRVGARAWFRFWIDKKGIFKDMVTDPMEKILYARLG